jgi:N12 class adenine-specific DNA methylase
MSQLAELVGAIRLPSGSHRRAAGTDAVMDLLILRSRRTGEPATDPGWARAVDVDGEQIRINAWLADRPEMILGSLAAGQGMYASDSLLVRFDAPLDQLVERLQHAAGTLVADARANGLATAARDTSRPVAAVGKERDVSLVDGGGDEAVALAPAVEWDGHTIARANVQPAYSTYEDQYGPLNRYTLRRTGRVDADSGEERIARITPPAVRLLCKHDPFGPLVRALENFDESTQTAAPAALLTDRVVAPRAPRLGADTPQDALAICLDRHARVDLEEIARPLGTTTQDAREQLGARAWPTSTTSGSTASCLRDYSTAGAQLALPGVARTFAPRPHQRAAVARIVAEPAVGLFH